MSSLAPEFLQPQQLERPPSPVRYIGFVARHDLLLEVLDGVELGSYDERILNWLAAWDYQTVATIASLIARAKAVEP